MLENDILHIVGLLILYVPVGAKVFGMRKRLRKNRALIILRRNRFLGPADSQRVVSGSRSDLIALRSYWILSHYHWWLQSTGQTHL
ncbi:hypothetical protein DFJ43DRAFT_743654 [Lentinula guzmanii]|uniref:Uncharacterized protein n=1 Tax=Lentinula guzmanii TaxID=2804957 RepID=A0AA38MWB2_9AGAR|nr:hypothetical protein DFJ43DRAFT_743654 [Lentinula guzmanii]